MPGRRAQGGRSVKVPVVAVAVLGLAGCMIGGRDTWPSVVHRTHDRYVATSDASTATARDTAGNLYTTETDESGGEGWGWAVGAAFGAAQADVHDVAASGFATSARLQGSLITSRRLGFAVSALWGTQSLVLDDAAGELDYGGLGAEARVLYAPIDLFVFEAGLAAHRGALAWKPATGMSESASVTGATLALAAGYTVNYPGLAVLVSFETQLTRTSSAMLGAVDTSLASRAYLMRFLLAF